MGKYDRQKFTDSESQGKKQKRCKDNVFGSGRPGAVSGG